MSATNTCYDRDTTRSEIRENGPRNTTPRNADGRNTIPGAGPANKPYNIYVFLYVYAYTACPWPRDDGKKNVQGGEGNNEKKNQNK